MKLVIFSIVWLLTFGKHHFWILPNLTEDVGFFESFWPLYKHDASGSDKTDKNEIKDKKKSEDDKPKQITCDEVKEGDGKDSETESVSTNESVVRNEFEILDANECDT